MVEIDVTASRDGEFYCFHDGCEAETLGFEANLQTLHGGRDRPGVLHLGGPARTPGPGGATAADAAVVSREAHAVQRRPFVVALAELLRRLDGLYMAHQLVMKCPAWEEAALRPACASSR